MAVTLEMNMKRSGKTSACATSRNGVVGDPSCEAAIVRTRSSNVSGDNRALYDLDGRI